MADTTIELTRDNPATVVVLSVLLAAEIALAAMHAPMIVIVLVILAAQAFGYVSSRKGHQRRVHISGRLKLVYHGLVLLPVGLMVSIIVALTNGRYAALTVGLAFILMQLLVSSAIVFRSGRRSA